MLPFKEKIIKETDTYILVQRDFMSSLTSEELNWHRDKEDREVVLVEGQDWYIQLDNELPRLLSKDTSYNIPKSTWHRIINRNSSKLVINVRKYK
jgi:mannose-6-phosphate isomerase-like protein (cupin superfamily)